MLSAPLNIHIMQALEAGPLAPLDLRRAANSPPQSTMRVYLRDLTAVGVLERHRQDSFPPVVKYALTAGGRALLKVGEVLQAWLQAAPEGAILLGTPASKSATRALVDGWSTNIVRALAARPYSLTELSRLNNQTSYPALERRLAAMRLVNQVEPVRVDGRGTPYRATEWLRQAIFSLTAATAWERRCLPDESARIGRLDVEAAFLLAAPLMKLPSDLNGTVRLGVEVQGGASPVIAGAIVRVQNGKVTASSNRLEGRVDASVTGTAMAWLRQMRGGATLQVEIGGNQAFGELVADALRASAVAAFEPLDSSVN
jgi:DNA-binding HxlR family transcriptional regulator